MKHTNQPQQKVPKNTVLSQGPKQSSKSQPQKQKASKAPKYKLDFIKKDNFDLMHTKINITQIKQLQIKYVLNCIEGIFKNRFLYITTHKDGEVLGSGDAKINGLTLQIQSAGLSPKHARLKFDGFKNFDVYDYGSENGTWLNIPKEGVQIKNNQEFSVGPYVVNFTFAEPISEIQQVCMIFHVNYLSDVLEYNGIKTFKQLFEAQYNKFKDFPFSDKDIEKILRICSDVKRWYIEDKKYHRLNVNFLNEPLINFSFEIGWQSFYFSKDPDYLFNVKNPLAQINKGKLIPNEKVFTKIQSKKLFPLGLHNQLKIGNLMFELNRFNSGVGSDIGSRASMEDGIVIQEDIGGSEWKLISLIAIFDGHGGSECMEFMKSNIVEKVRSWTSLLDQSGDLNQMLKILMNKSFYELDYEFYKLFPELSLTCGATGLITFIIESRVFVFSVGDCKGHLFRNDVLYQLNLDHLPSRGDERLRIQNAGGFIQYDRLMGKCMLSRCFGQFQYKNVEDYENNMKGKLKSYLSCLPDAISFEIQPDKDDFILLSSDGIYQNLTIAEVTEMIGQKYNKLEAEESPNKIVSSIIESCKILSNDCDNMAVVLIVVRKGMVGAPKAW